MNILGRQNGRSGEGKETPRSWRDPFVLTEPTDPVVSRLIRARNRGEEVTFQMIDDAAQAAELARDPKPPEGSRQRLGRGVLRLPKL